MSEKEMYVDNDTCFMDGPAARQKHVESSSVAYDEVWKTQIGEATNVIFSYAVISGGVTDMSPDRYKELVNSCGIYAVISTDVYRGHSGVMGGWKQRTGE